MPATAWTFCIDRFRIHVRIRPRSQITWYYQSIYALQKVYICPSIENPMIETVDSIWLLSANYTKPVPTHTSMVENLSGIHTCTNGKEVSRWHCKRVYTISLEAWISAFHTKPSLPPYQRPTYPWLFEMETFQLFGDLRLEDPTSCLTMDHQLELAKTMPLIEALESRSQSKCSNLCWWGNDKADYPRPRTEELELRGSFWKISK